MFDNLEKHFKKIKICKEFKSGLKIFKNKL